MILDKIRLEKMAKLKHFPINLRYIRIDYLYKIPSKVCNKSSGFSTKFEIKTNVVIPLRLTMDLRGIY